MQRVLVAAAILLSLAWLGTAVAQFSGGQNGVPGCGPQVGGTLEGTGVPGCAPGVPSGGTGGGPPPVTNFILLVDNSSHLLQTNNASHVCIAGGC